MTSSEDDLIDLLYDAVVDAERWDEALAEARKSRRSLAAIPELAEAFDGREHPSSFVLAERRDDRRDVEADAIRAKRLAPHLARASRLREAFERLQAEVRGLACVVDRLGAGLIVLDGRGQSLHINAAARKFIARKDGLTLDRGGRLRAAKHAADRTLALMQDAPPEGRSGGVAQVPRDGEARPYAVLVAPLPTDPACIPATDEDRAGALVLVHDPDSANKPSVRALAEIFGLTPRAAELTAALAAGEELKGYADRAGLSLHTVRFHLKSAFQRMGVRSQAQLVRLAVRAMAELHF